MRLGLVCLINSFSIRSKDATEHGLMYWHTTSIKNKPRGDVGLPRHELAPSRHVAFLNKTFIISVTLLDADTSSRASVTGRVLDFP